MDPCPRRNQEPKQTKKIRRITGKKYRFRRTDGRGKNSEYCGCFTSVVSQLPKPEMATSLGDCCRKERKDSGCNRNNQEESSVDVRTRSMVVNSYCRAYSVYILWRGVGFSLGI